MDPEFWGEPLAVTYCLDAPGARGPKTRDARALHAPAIKGAVPGFQMTAATSETAVPQRARSEQGLQVEAVRVLTDKSDAPKAPQARAHSKRATKRCVEFTPVSRILSLIEALRSLPLSSRLAKPDHQFSETWPVLFAHSREFQCQSAAGLHAPYYAVGPDLPLLNQKLQLDYGTQAL